MREHLSTHIRFYRERTIDWAQGLNERERILLIAAGVIAVFFIVFSGVETVISRMNQQKNLLIKAEQDYESLGPLLQRYNRLALQKSDIESEFLQESGRLPARSYIEDIAKNQAKITSQLNINNTGSDDFGQDFRRLNFKVSFQTGDLDQLVSFLQAIEEGPQPLLLTRIDINRIGTQLRFTAEISSIELK